MPKHNPIYTPRFDEVLTELVGTLGEAKWAEITRQMKTIYGLSIPHKPMVQARWRAIDPKINRQIFSAEETVTHWHICVKYKCHWDAVKAEYEAIGQIRDKCFLSQKFYAHFQFKLVDLNRMMGKMVAYNQPKIENMRDTTKKRILEINAREPQSVKDQSAREIIQSCQMLIKLLTYVVDNHKEDYKVITEELKKMITPEKFARVLQNIFIIDLIVLIACNELKPSDETPDFIKMDERKKIKYKKPTKVKRWDEALLLSSSPENTEDEDVLRTEQEINKVTGGTNFTKADIEEIKQSPIYCVCNTDQNQTFYDWYNEAKIQKATLKTDLLVDVMDIMNNNKDKQKSEKTKPVQKRTALLAKKQMKLIEKKKNELMKQDKDDKIKTVRGKIKIDKEVFPGCYTKFFDKEDEDDYEDSQDNPIYSAIDADQIYQIIMQQKQAQDN
ncbi:unnamed protein product [Paramecium primaurelia]|uniref:Uncharacterized protein n=2 Tax=Paramecium TaxID=5884 RepID=A0A8S1U0Z9_9CILI|nr:unnamed protein product [Paramecium primaurelia]CAD8157633.1 unnamed protein product [Paramecium pentaurelia]